RLESCISIAQQNANESRHTLAAVATVGHNQVGLAVAVHIGDSHRAGTSTAGIIYEVPACERAIAVTCSHSHRADGSVLTIRKTAKVGHHHVRLTVAVHVGDRY